MKIINVTPGLLPIPPNGWGAVEKIIWEYHNAYVSMGHDSHIMYLDQAMEHSYDVLHVHVANLANMVHAMGKPYYFSMHDHHAYLYGKDSFVFKENYEAIRNSVLTFLPSQFLVDYFGLPNAVYVPHGVNLSYFTPNNTTIDHSILCVANNGYANNPSYDRKGFGLAIEVAKILNIPITICGPRNNKNFFDTYDTSYDKLTIKYDLTEDQLRTEYRQHTIFLHLSELEAGHPNLTLLEALASGLPVVATMERLIDGIYVVSRNVDEAVHATRSIMANYTEYKQMAINSASSFKWDIIVGKMLTYFNFSGNVARNKFIKCYEDTSINIKPITQPQLKVSVSYQDGVKIDLRDGPLGYLYDVLFVDTKTGNVVYTTQMSSGCWAAPSIKYYIKWRVIVKHKGEILFDTTLDLSGKTVLIEFESSSLGDTIAWFPYVDEFRKRHNCNVVCTTFWNHLFMRQYPNIKFQTPGDTVDNIYASYKIGWFYHMDGTLDMTKHVDDIKKQPLQKTSSDILGLEYFEIKPKIDINRINKNRNEKLITIATQSTAQAKYWNRADGWYELVELLKADGYEVQCIDKHHTFGIAGSFNSIPKNVTDLTGNYPIEERIDQILNSKLFIGLGSGLSWLSWALDVPTAIISGFSEPMCEPTDVIRIETPSGMCTGCFNRTRLDPSDWLWCPEHKGTERQFECSKSITPIMVYNKIKQWL